ncbi:TniQ family protein [Burkholderia anthina]|uniref:TniQ family protein n=1 Tax=Burkholderia anthina TaxID=179879 RepID=UPI001589C870|nr:TniQ family protein [Burkholderia anthina]
MAPITFASSARDDNHHRWAGADLSPLPFESAISLFWRFCWRNVLGRRDARDLISRTTGQRQLGMVDLGKFSNATGWNATEVSQGSAKLRDCLFEKRLRICPICLESAYHSVWHQFQGLRICPIHSCQLLPTCAYCDAGTMIVTDYFRHNARRMRCVFCGQYLAGAAPNLTAHIDLQDQSGTLATHFGALDKWWSDYAGVLGMISELEPIESSDRKARRRLGEYLIASLFDVLTPVPGYPANSSGSLNVFQWSASSNRPGRTRADYHVKSSAYSNALGKLLRWAIREPDHARQLRDIGRALEQRWATDVTLYSPPVVAVRLTRNWFEGYKWDIHHATDPHRHALRPDAPLLSAVCQPVLRLEIQAFVSAICSAFLHDVRQATEQGWSLSSETLRQSGPAAAGVCKQEGKLFSGLIVFPGNDDVPYSPLRRHQFGEWLTGASSTLDRRAFTKGGNG